eukprot:COSAG02_NODE_2165_length_9612_cov_20.785451_7_plen_65_part_00
MASTSGSELSPSFSSSLFPSTYAAAALHSSAAMEERMGLRDGLEDVELIHMAQQGAAAATLGKT